MVSEVQGGQNRVRHVQIHPWDTLGFTTMDFIQLSKRIFFFCSLGLGGSVLVGFGQVFAFRLVRKHKEKVPKYPRKGPPEARTCGFSGNSGKKKDA